jgi:hypothetical protein
MSRPILFNSIGHILVSAATAIGGDAPDWAVPDRAYRIAVTVEPGSSPRTNCPVGVQVDFARLFTGAGIPGHLDRNSIRFVRYDSVAKQSVERERGNFEIPFQLTGDFPNDDAGRGWWRMRDECATHYHIYFDSLANGRKQPPSRMGLIGVGDSFHYNNGQPGPAPAHPLHSQYWHGDWHGDGIWNKELSNSNHKTF